MRAAKRLSFAVHRDRHEFHRVVPVEGPEALLLKAGLVGQAICEHIGLFEPERVHIFDFHRLLFQQRSRIREAIRWHPNSPSDLRIAPTAEVNSELFPITHRNRWRRVAIPFCRATGFDSMTAGVMRSGPTHPA